MGHYRKLSVEGKNYRFNIGKKFVELRDDEENEKYIIEKTDIGIKSIYGEWIVTPKMIVDYIQNGKIQTVDHYFETCKCKGVAKTLELKPYESEIKYKHIYAYWCKNCFDNNADDI